MKNKKYIMSLYKKNRIYNSFKKFDVAIKLCIFFILLIITEQDFAQKNQNISNPITNSSLLVNTNLGDWKKIEIEVKGNLSNEVSSRNRQYFLLKNKDKSLNIVWQDKSNQNVYITTLMQDLKTSKTIQAFLPAKTNLLAVANDENNNLYIMVFDEAKDEENDFITLCKVAENGKLVSQKVHSSLKKDLNIYKIGNYGGTMVYSNGILGFFMARKMNKGGDGLNHQGGIGVVFDATTLGVITNTGQTSGHSFDNYLTKNNDGDFIGIDLGDNYPRGINLHRMTKEERICKLVYTFKTLHGIKANGYGTIYPEYKEISSSKQSYYKWSNDNNTYCELGGVVEVSDGYLVIFAGEPDANGKALNNSRISENTDPRNLGFVKVSKDFYEYGKNDFIISKGVTEKGGFYTFGGSWTEQQNQGINWLTKYKDKNTEKACNIKTQLLPDGNILILWSKQSGKYSSPSGNQTMMMCLDSNGKITQPAIELGSDILLNRRDEILLIDNKIFSVNGKDNKLQVSFLELK